MATEVDPKSPNEDYEFEIDWSDVLAAGEQVASAEWTIPTGLTGHDDEITESGTLSSIFISGGTHGEQYKIVCKAITNNAVPRTYERSFLLTVLDV